VVEAVAVEGAAIEVLAAVAVEEAGVSPVAVRQAQARSGLIVRLARVVILGVARLAVGAGKAALRNDSRAGKAPPVSCNLVNKQGMLRVRPAAKIQLETCNPGNGLATLLTAKTGRITVGNNNKTGSKLPETDKKTGRIMEGTPAKTGRSTGRITTTVAAIGAGDTMEATQRGE
jgi:hypothetical protein